MDECPVEPRIPLYLFVGRCFTFLIMLTILWHHLRSVRSERDDADWYVADAYTAEVNTTLRTSKLAILFSRYSMPSGSFWGIFRYFVRSHYTLSRFFITLIIGATKICIFYSD